VTTAVREAPHHRNLTCYTDYHCRRPECVERRRQWQRDLRRRNREGQPALVDAQPVRDHLLALQAAGISINAVARAAGLDEWTLRNFLPSPSSKRPRKHRVTPATKQKILAVTADQAALGYVDGTGSRRRIQALVADGWPMRRLADYIGCSPTYVGDLVRRTEKDHPIRRATAAKVAQAYEHLRTQRPARHGIEARQIRRMRKLATERKWPTPAYWAERMDVIDDPHFEPLYGVTRRLIIAQDANEVMRFSGLTREAAAERLGVSKAYIDHAFRDHPEYAIGVAA
jgi:AraC-like DNA-binding protein